MSQYSQQRSVETPSQSPRSKSAPGSPADLLYAAELIKAVGGDIAQLARLHSEGVGELEKLVKQVGYLREVMDYSLFVTPEQTDKEDDLYPFATWLRNQFNTVTDSVHEHSAKLSQKIAAGRDTDELENALKAGVGKLEQTLLEGIATVQKSLGEAQSSDTINRELAGELSVELGNLTRELEQRDNSLNKRLDELFTALGSIDEQQQEHTKQLLAQRETSSQQGDLNPYDDFDVQVEELREFIRLQTSRWGAHQNFFYGLVILLLIVNTMMLCWIYFAR